MTIDEPVISALCRLNSHARAFGCGKRAIYAYKTLVAAMLASSGEIAVRLVEWVGPCGRCSGTGIYQGWYGPGDKAPCYHCRRGTVTLRFVETKFPDGVVWHHPFDVSSGGPDIAKAAGAAFWCYDRYKDAEGREVWFAPVTSNWTPRLTGERLNVDEAALALNTVEAWVLTQAFPHRWTEHGRDVEGKQEPVTNTLHWLVSSANRELRGYGLDIGRIGFKCWYCGSQEITCGLCRMGLPFTWSAPVCAEHQKTPVDQWPAKDDLPAWAITPPLSEWRERHERLGFRQNQ
jgi:hypothetical protein